MNTFIKKLESFITPVANWLSNNKIIQSISKGLMITMPIIMVGAIASVFQNIPITGYQHFVTTTYFGTILTTIVNITTNMLAVYVVAAISYTYAGTFKLDQFVCALLALMGFFIVTPLTVSGKGIAAVTNIPLSWLGAKGLFTAMIIAIATTLIYLLIVKKNLVIKMPDSVPPFVSKSFAAIIPGFATVLVFGIVAFLFSITPYKDMHDAIYSLIQVPLSHVGTSVWAAALIYLLSGLCWFFGIHGIAVISVVMPIWIGADVANASALSAGKVAPNIITYNWINAVSSPGGSGATIGLIILATFFAKSERYRSLGKLAIVPSLFNINEPVVFGLPMVLNAIMAIPFILTPVINVFLGYILTVAKILPVSNGVGSMGMPILMNSFLCGGWKLMVFQIFTIFLSLAIYYPFFKILDNREVAEEQK
ncbi:PTS sugar transporter subunit IIC [Xylocopilactobacillus apicola]|uniref:Permease IIC component n=1 Tax=Xylocopilactobacillus apicola TaxID=2932184 RepID=A0AAU9DSE6_9LACO|nr:PTS transporter subunit EIIC [Xylocopilactobacillus apicola]BDR58954.1 permease IIC component [Xylocopilactobacillus apicola]